MPAPDTQADRRGGGLLNGLFWVGVGLAPLAALLLLFGESGTALRIALVLALLAVILIGLSIALRRNSGSVRAALEDQLIDEVEALRKDVREDIATAARATHRAFGEKLQVLYQNVEALRAQLEAVRAEPGRAAPDRGAADRATYDRAGYDRAGYDRAGYDRAGYDRAGYDRAAPRSAPPQMSSPPMSGPPTMGGQAPGFTPEPGRAGAGGRAPGTGGVVRHTETVQVTTRQTIVDPLGDDSARGTVYGGGYTTRGPETYAGRGPETYAGRGPESYAGRGPEGYAAQGSEGYAARGQEGHAARGPEGYAARGLEPTTGDWSTAPPRGRRSAEPDEPAWRDQRPYEPPTSGGVYGTRRDDTSDGRYSELRMGERRAAMRSDDTGTEMRIEDRWAAVRREDAQRSADRWEPPRQGDPQRGRGDRRDGSQTGSWRTTGSASWATGSASWASGSAPLANGSAPLANGSAPLANGDAGSWNGNNSGPWNEARWDRALPPGGIEVTGPWTEDWIESEREPAREPRDRRQRDEGYGGWR